MKTAVYKNSLEYAAEHNEKRLYSDSLNLNMDCAIAIDEAIAESHNNQHSYKLSDALSTIINDFGIERVTWVVAATIQHYNYDGRLSNINKEWAKEFSIPDIKCADYLLKTHLAVLDGFVNKLRNLKIEEQTQTEQEAAKEPTEPTETTSKKGFLKLDKEEFFETEFGEGLTYATDLLDDCYIARSKCAEREDWKEHHLYCCRINELNTALEVFQAAVKQFYGIEYQFRRTDDYYGFCTKDGSDWLFKVKREIE